MKQKYLLNFNLPLFTFCECHFVTRLPIGTFFDLQEGKQKLSNYGNR